MIGDLISRSALLAAIQTDVENGGVSGMVAGALKRYVKRAPAVEAVPVRTGRWINEVELHPELYGWVPLNSVVCSECKKSNGIEKPWCPNCGAKMDLEE